MKAETKLKKRKTREITVLNFKLPSTLKEAVKKVAGELDTDVSKFCRRALRSEIARQHKQSALHQS